MFDDLIKAHGDEVRDGKNTLGISIFSVITADEEYQVKAHYNTDGTPKGVVITKLY